MMNSALYVGTVSHRRLSPRKHHLRYRVFWLLIDLDETGRVDKSLRLFSHNRFNLFGFHDRDHGDEKSAHLRDYVVRELARHGMSIGNGRIRLLCMPRILGFVFNPLSIYYCHREDGALEALLYEVRNTFGQKHSYLIPVTADAPVVRQQCDKGFYVSPFMDMDLTYDFRIAQPAAKVSAVVACGRAGSPVLVASLTAQRRALTDGALASVFLTHPLLTLKVVGAIHWEALKLWLKGMRLRTRPPAPSLPVTFIAGGQVQDTLR